MAAFAVMEPSPASAPRLVTARGPRAAEAVVLAAVERHLAASREGLAGLAEPVRVVVPSRSLRLHVAAELVRRRGRATVGVVVQTLHALALEVLERTGDAPRGGEPLFAVLAAQLAREERAFDRLGSFEDGYRTVTGTVRDLLDAGFDASHREAAEEALAEDGPAVAPRQAVERARALVRLAAATERAMAALGAGRTSDLFRRAAEALAVDPATALPARAVLVHGFADATGVAADLLAALAERRGATVVVDLPPDPAAPGSPAVEDTFPRLFLERLTLAAGRPRAATADARSPELPVPPYLLAATGADAESREIARRLRTLLDAGARPEGIGIVARDLVPYTAPLRRWLRRMGVPHSGVGATASLGPAGRRIRAMLDVLRRRGDVPVGRWLDACARLPGSATGERAAPAATGTASAGALDLRLALAALGAGRLAGAAALPPERFAGDGSLPLPVRRGFVGGEDGTNDEDEAETDEGREASRRRTTAARRRVSHRRLAPALAAARRLDGRLRDWPRRAPLGEHARRLEQLLRDDLGWRDGTAVFDRFFADLDAFVHAVPAAFELGLSEWTAAVAELARELGADPLGGRGGGVQVLTVTEARGRTFEHLFVVGLNRGLFPRPVREDPLLADPLRRVLRRVLPEMPVKREGTAEERYLFATLLAAAPAVTLSWQTTDDDGRPAVASPLLERLAHAPEPVRVPAATSLARAGDPTPRPPGEAALLVGLHGDRDRFAAVLPAAVAAARGGAGVLALEPPALARSRVAVLDELDPERPRTELGPYFGFVGPEGGGRDPRSGPIAVTALERLAGCPWQTFLERLLRLEPSPDPLAALPGLDRRLVGNLVHAVLERIMEEAGVAGEEGGRSIEAVIAADEVVAVSWPAPSRLDELLEGEALRIVEEEGLAPPLARALAATARPLLAAAGASDWAGGPVPVAGVEVVGALDLPRPAGPPRRLTYRADRLDRTAEGWIATDYKTGRPLFDGARPETRSRKLDERIASGQALQTAAYALGLAAAAPTGGAGRYLFLRPDLADDRRSIEIAPGPALEERLSAAVDRLLDLWEAGAFFPRLVEPDKDVAPARCDWCAVRDACLQGDSGARRRLGRWAEKATEGEEPSDPACSALLGVWTLGADGGKERQ